MVSPIAIKLARSNIGQADLIRLADAFDEIVADNIAWIRAGRAAGLEELSRRHGTGVLYQSVAFTSYTGELALTLLQGMGQGAVDLVRVGETLRDPSLGAFGRDALRVISVVPAGSFGRAGRLLRIERAKVVTGGIGGCGPVSLLKASMLSGRRLVSPWFRSFKGFLPKRHPWSPYAGQSGVFMAEMLEVAARNGIPMRYLALGPKAGLRQIADMAARLDGPIYFFIRWSDDAGHFMTVASTPRGVRFMDQFGDAWRLTEAGGLVNEAPSALGRSIPLTEIVPAQIRSIGPSYAIPEARLFRALEHAEAAALATQLGLGAAQSRPDVQPVLAQPVFWAHPNLVRVVEAIVRQATLRPRPLYPWEQPGAKPAAPEPPGLIVVPSRDETAPRWIE